MAADAGVEMKGDGGHGDVRGPGRQARGHAEELRRGRAWGLMDVRKWEVTRACDGGQRLKAKG